MKVIITGASGYIGARLCLFLAQIGHEVIGVFSKNIPQKEGWTELLYHSIIGDIREEKTINLISEVHADAIIHLVSLDHNDSEKEPNLVLDVNVKPTWNLLNSCTKNGLKKFIYFSTIHIYGKKQKGFIDETQKKTPFNAYGLTHALSEEVVSYYNRKTDTSCINIRLSNSYGEPVFYDAKCWSLIVNDLTRSAFLEKKIVLNGDGKAMRDFIHFSDICIGISGLLESEESPKKSTFHFSSATSISMLDVAVEVQKEYKNIYGLEIPIFINKVEEYKSEIKNDEKSSNVISNSLAESYGISFLKGLNFGINDLFNYLEKENAKN